MAKKASNNSKPVQAPKPKQEIVVESAPEVRDPAIPAWLYDFKIQALIVGILAFVFYFNTTFNEYALDDTIVIVKNEYVYEGFAGIKDILTKDAYDSYYRQFNSSNQLSGGRYRPLSIVTFAIEQQFFGAIPREKVDSVMSRGFTYQMKEPFERRFITDMHIRHFFNVLWFTLCVIVLLYFLRYVVFKNNVLIAFLAAIIFTIHPIHTEVIANVKSRDEIMSLLLMCLTFIFAFKYEEHKKKWMLGAALVSFFLAFLAKEYAITMVALLPLAFFSFRRYTVWNSIKATLPYVAVMIFYVYMRLQIVAPMNESSDADLLNNPYAGLIGHANEKAEKLATQIATTLNYIRLLIFPQPLSADYSYNSIPYKDFTHPLVWLSLFVHGGLIYYFFKFFGMQLKPAPRANAKEPGKGVTLETARVLCFAITFYLLNMFIISNIFFNIGGTMGERLIFHSSVGFSIAVAYLLYKGAEMIKPAATGRMALAGIMVLLIVLCGFKTIERNKDWKNDETLFAEDIKSTPNSVLVNANVASSLINKAEAEKDSLKKRYLLHEGVKYYDKTLSIHTTFVSGFMNRFVAYLKLDEPDSAKFNLDQVRMYYPNYPKMEEIYYNLGVCYYMKKEIPQAINSWQIALKLKPNYLLAQQSINTAMQALQAQQKGLPVNVTGK